MATGHRSYGDVLLGGTPSITCGGPKVEPMNAASEAAARALCGDDVVDKWAPDFMLCDEPWPANDHSPPYPVREPGAAWTSASTYIAPGPTYWGPHVNEDFAIEGWIMPRYDGNANLSPNAPGGAFYDSGSLDKPAIFYGCVPSTSVWTFGGQAFAWVGGVGFGVWYWRSTGIGTVSIVAPTWPAVGEWIHVCANFDRSANMEFFINGISQGTVAVDGVAAITGFNEAWLRHPIVSCHDSVTAANMGPPCYIASMAWHGRLMTGSEIERSVKGRRCYPLDLSYQTTHIRDVEFNTETTAAVTNLADVDIAVDFGAPALNGTACGIRRGNTDGECGIIPDRSGNERHFGVYGHDTPGANDYAVWFGPDSFFWRSG